jgi:hypothetical protein
VGKTADCSMERRGRRWWWVDQGGCLDPVATGPYGGSRAAREEKTTRRRNRGPAQPPMQARWKKIGVLGLRFIPNRYKEENKQKYQVAIRSDTGEAQEELGRHRLAGANSITRAQVESRTRITQEKEKRKAAPDPSVW